jgi:hypothetical protein
MPPSLKKRYLNFFKFHPDLIYPPFHDCHAQDCERHCCSPASGPAEPDSDEPIRCDLRSLGPLIGRQSNSTAKSMFYLNDFCRLRGHSLTLEGSRFFFPLGSFPKLFPLHLSTPEPSH